MPSTAVTDANIDLVLKIIAADFTKSTASYFVVKSWEIPTAKPTLSSNVEILIM